MIHGTVHGIDPEPFPGGMEWNGMEWKSLVKALLHPTVSKPARLPRRPATLAASCKTSGAE